MSMNPNNFLSMLFGQNGEGIQPGLGQSSAQNSGDTQQNLQGPMSPTVQPTGPKVVQKVSGSSGGGGGFGLPLGPLAKILGGSGGASGGASAATGAAGGSSSGLGGALGGLFSNPFTIIPAVAVGGAASLSADSASAGKGAGIENWLGPLYNIPEALSRGDWGDVMKDGALGPIGAVYNIANGKDALKSVMNSFGPAGQLPYLLGSGQMPYSGGNTSKNFMSAFQGRGV